MNHHYTLYNSPPLSAVLLSVISVPCGQLQSKNIKWKPPEIKRFISFKLYTVLSSTRKSSAAPRCPAQNANHPWVQRLLLTSSRHVGSVSSHVIKRRGGVSTGQYDSLRKRHCTLITFIAALFYNRSILLLAISVN